MSSELTREFESYLAHQEEMVEQYDGRVIALKGGRVLGVYDSELAAVTELQKSHALGTFLLQKVTPGDSAYTQTFYSPRAVFQ